MKKFKIKVTTSGTIILPNGRKVRTPVILNLNEKELNECKVQFNARGLSYKIEDVTEDDKSFKELPTISKKVVIEELTSQKEKNDSEPKTFLDKLIADQEN
jgi:hypothetical protein